MTKSGVVGQKAGWKDTLALNEKERRKALTRTYEETRMGLHFHPGTIPAMVSESGVETKTFATEKQMADWLSSNSHKLFYYGLGKERSARMLADSRGRPRAVVRFSTLAVQIESISFPCPSCGSDSVVVGELSRPDGSAYVACGECGSPERIILANPLVCKKCDNAWIPT